MIRPGLCIATARAFGAPTEHSVGSAVALEMLHNGILIHDDVEDGSELRRGRPTLHAIHGVPIAVNAGDMLLLLGLRPLIDNFGILGPELAISILRETERTAWAVAKGQAMELQWCRENMLQLQDSHYLDMVFKKTAWLGMVCPARVGALIGSHGGADLDRFLRFGLFLGAAFQIQDDLRNLSADPLYGKEGNGDLYEGKRTLMMLHAARHCTPEEKEELRKILAPTRAERSDEDVEWMSELIERHGSVEYAQGIGHAMAGAALFEFDRAYGDLPDSADKQLIHDLCSWVLERN